MYSMIGSSLLIILSNNDDCINKYAVTKIIFFQKVISNLLLPKRIFSLKQELIDNQLTLNFIRL